MNAKRRDFYALCWELGGSQSDVANLSSEDVDWVDRTICYNRRKLKSLVFRALIEAASNLANWLYPALSYFPEILVGHHRGSVRITNFS